MSPPLPLELLALAIRQPAAPERRPTDDGPASQLANDNLATASSRVGAAPIQTILATWREVLVDLGREGANPKAVP